MTSNIIRINPEVGDMVGAFHLNAQIDKRETQREIEFLRSLIVRDGEGNRQIDLSVGNLSARSKADVEAAWSVIENWPHLTLYASGDPSRFWYKVVARVKGYSYLFDSLGSHRVTNRLASQVIADNGLVRVTPMAVIENWQNHSLDQCRQVERVLVRLHGAINAEATA